MGRTLNTFSRHVSRGARRVAKHMRTNQGFNHFIELTDHRCDKPYLLGYKRVRGNKITTVAWPV